MIEDDIEYDDIDGGGWQRRWHQWQQVPVGEAGRKPLQLLCDQYQAEVCEM